MRVDQDLRIAIKAAAGCSKNQNTAKNTFDLIAAWLKKFPKKAAKARALVKAIEAADAAEKKAREQLDKLCMTDEAAFVKAGGQNTPLRRLQQKQQRCWRSTALCGSK